MPRGGRITHGEVETGATAANVSAYEDLLKAIVASSEMSLTSRDGGEAYATFKGFSGIKVCLID